MEREPDTNPHSSVNATGRDVEPYIGGADAVEKTTASGSVHGAEAHAPRTPDGVAASVPHRGGPGVFGWFVLALVVLVALAYLLGLLA